MSSPRRTLLLLLLFSFSYYGVKCKDHASPLANLVKDYKLGATFCKFLAWKLQIHHRTDCGEPQCLWDSWRESHLPPVHHSHDHLINERKNHRIVVSYAHNGFGNQLWQHTFAVMLAQSLNASLYVDVLPEDQRPDGHMPVNTWQGFDTSKRLLPPDLLYENLPENSHVRRVCDEEKFFLADRPRDWRNRDYANSFKTKLSELIVDPKPRCLKLVGYFQNLPLCFADAKALWTPPLFANFTQGPEPDDVSVYLRCVPRHYHFNSVEWYTTILEGMKPFKKVWMFQAPECPNSLGNDPTKDGPVAAVIRLLIDRYNATKWPAAPEGSDGVSFLLSDLAGLARSKRLVLPVSSWAFWGGVLSDAAEIHVNAPPHHPLMEYNGKLYVYHDEKARTYFGRFNLTEYDLVYSLDLNKMSSSTSTLSSAKRTSDHGVAPVPSNATSAPGSVPASVVPVAPFPNMTAAFGNATAVLPAGQTSAFDVNKSLDVIRQGLAQEGDKFNLLAALQAVQQQQLITQEKQRQQRQRPHRRSLSRQP